MPYQKCKVYNDGSHFIAIPHTTRPVTPKRYLPEEVIEVVDGTPQKSQLNADKCNVETVLTALNDTNEVASGEYSEAVETTLTDKTTTPAMTRKMTSKQLFDELYEECKDMKYKGKKEFIQSHMSQYFKFDEEAR